MKIGLLGKKIGMTRVYDASGKATPVTVIEAGGNTALQIKNEANDGYAAVQVGFDTQKEQRVTKPLLGHFKKAESECSEAAHRSPVLIETRRKSERVREIQAESLNLSKLRVRVERRSYFWEPERTQSL